MNVTVRVTLSFSYQFNLLSLDSPIISEVMCNVGEGELQLYEGPNILTRDSCMCVITL